MPVGLPVQPPAPGLSVRAAPVEPPVPAPQAAARMPVGLPVQPPAPGLPVRAAPVEPPVPAPQAAARMPVGLPVQPPAPGLPVRAAPVEPPVPAPQAAAKISTYNDVEKAIATDKAAGESVIAKYQAEADKAAKDVAAKRDAQTKAEEDAKRFRQQAAVNRGHVTGIEKSCQTIPPSRKRAGCGAPTGSKALHVSEHAILRRENSKHSSEKN